MRYKKLLAKVTLPEWVEPSPHFAALRAIVLWHRPIGKYCPRCSINDWGYSAQEYPCDTLKIIEKELSA